MDVLHNIAGMFLGNKENKNVAGVNARNLKKYEEAKKTGEYLMLSFTRADAITGDLSFVEDDITVVMKSDQISGKPYALKYRAQKLEEQYCVKVLNIDTEKKIVEVSHHAARCEKRPEIEKELDKYLARKEQTPIMLKGKVMKVQRKKANEAMVDTGVWLDLCGVGIPGYIYIGNWKKTFTETLQGKVNYGDVVDVMVLSKVDGKNGMYYYSCSRKELVDDPWDSKELHEKYHKGDIVKIKCLSKRDNFWYGEINGLPDIQVLAEYPSHKHDFSIVPGFSYLGTLYHVDIKERSLKARVFQALTFDKLAEESKEQTKETDTPQEG